MTSSARDLRYGRRGGRWAEGWSDEDEARYQEALAARQSEPEIHEPPSLFDLEDGNQ